MKYTQTFLILLILLCFYIPSAYADTDNNQLNNISTVTLEVPPTGTAPLGTKESMNEYQVWLDGCANSMISYANSILNLFGISGFNWNFNPPASAAPSTATPAPTVQVTAIPTLTIPDTPYRSTLIKVTGNNGQTISDNFSVNGPYWELWYTVDPLTTGGQDISSTKGSYSEVFPTLSIQVIDKTNGGNVEETIEPPGGIDKNLWERTGIDPRPWMQKFYEGYREYQLVITASNLKSYIVEARIPTAAAEKFGYITTASPTPTILPQKTYIVSVNSYRTDSSLNFVYEGGRDAARLQNITITSNDVYLGELAGGTGQTPLPQGTAATFPVTCPPLSCYVIGTGHFIDGTSETIFETTL